MPSLTRSTRVAAAITFPRTVSTSSGLLTIGQVETLDGLTSQDLAGVTHGIQNLVMSNKVQIAGIAATGQSYRPAHGLFAGAVRPGRCMHRQWSDPVSGTLLTGTLPPHASIDAVVDFVTPRTNQQLWLEYRDPVSARRPLIAIGAADPNAGNTPIVVPEEHTHAN